MEATTTAEGGDQFEKHWGSAESNETMPERMRRLRRVWRGTPPGQYAAEFPIGGPATKDGNALSASPGGLHDVLALGRRQPEQ